MSSLRVRHYDYLVTGGAGFIGSHLCESLLESGVRVLALDDLSTGTLANLERCVENDSFTYVVGSVLDEELVNECVDLSDTVIHLAAAVGVENVISRPVETIETNVRGTENVLQAACKKNRKVFLASTSEVYGKSGEAPFREDGDIVLGATCRSRWSYACSKAMDEFLALAYHKDRDLEIIIGRFFNTVGPRQTGEYGMVLPRFVDQALSGAPLTVYGDGTQTRCFCLVHEVVTCVRALLDCPEAIGAAVNIGSVEEVPILKLAELVREAADSSSEIVMIPYDEAFPKDFEDMNRRVPDVTRLRQLTGFAPQAGIAEIIEEVIAWRKSL